MGRFVSLFVRKISFFQQFFNKMPKFVQKRHIHPLVNYRILSIFEGPSPCAMTICGQIARAKAATDLRIFMCSGRLGLFFSPPKGFFYCRP